MVSPVESVDRNLARPSDLRDSALLLKTLNGAMNLYQTASACVKKQAGASIGLYRATIYSTLLDCCTLFF
jgi:hypothetical protein